MKQLVCFLLLLSSLGVSAKEPVGYYRLATGKKGAELKTALSKIVGNARMLGYGSGEGYTWQGFFSTDRNPDDDRVIDMYSNQPFYQSTFASVSGMHIEHSLPKSWWGAIENNAYKDLFHLYPAEGNINIRKNNLPLGKAAAGSYTNGVSFIGRNVFGAEYNENCFEPADEYKGDFARSYLYMSTAYEYMDKNWKSPMMQNNTYPVWQPWAIELLLEWHRQDPVSEKELKRIENVYAIQSNRNPFIDYPDLVDYIWGDKQNEAYPFPKETLPYVAYPNQWIKVDFGVMMIGTQTEQEIEISGDNLTMPLNAKLTGRNDDFVSLSTASIAGADVNNGTKMRIRFDAKSHAAINDTLKLYSDEIVDTVRVPISGISGGEFMALTATNITPTTVTLNWMNLYNTKDYAAMLYSGYSIEAGDLFISVYLEGTSYNKAVSIFNATGKSVDLSKYSIKTQTNGNGEFSGEIPLTGSLDNNKEIVIVAKGKYGTASQELLDISDMTAELNFNGNDAIALYHNDVQIDVVGNVNSPDDWGKDVTLTRKGGNPLITFDKNMWQSSNIDDFAALRGYTYKKPSTMPIEIGAYSTSSPSIAIENLNPNTVYHYAVKNGDTESVNKMYFVTDSLDIPEVLEATNVFSDCFDANWEGVAGALSYKLQLSEVSGPGYATDITDFTGVGSNGSPLPQGWTGTASGNYTTEASCGIASPSLAFKNSGEYIMSKVFDSPISSLKFMYRFPSSGAGNIIKVEALKGDAWQVVDEIVYQNTKKQYPEYTFSRQDAVKAIKLTFVKSSGNLSVDDIEIVSGYEEYITKEIPVKEAGYTVTGLKSLTRYQYKVKACHPAYESSYSTPISVTTNNTTSVTHIISGSETIKAYACGGIITVIGDTEAMVDGITIHSPMGEKVYESTGKQLPLTIATSLKGIYILTVSTKEGTTSIKLII